MNHLMATRIEQARSLPFVEGVWMIVEMIPKGRVLGYGHLATLLGYPNHARQAGFALSKCPSNRQAPWWRVIRSDGSIPNHGNPIKNEEHRLILQTEQVVFKGSKVDMCRSKWTPAIL